MIYKSNLVVGRIADTACRIQDASNGRAVAGELVEAMDKLRKEQDMSTEDLNRHPVVCLLLHKLNTLAGIPDEGGGELYRLCVHLRDGEDVER